jgi:hypothetical protein
MNYPKIKFIYSWIYDKTWKEGFFIKKKRLKNYPSPLKIEGYLKKVEKSWKKVEKKILTELYRITHLKWKEKSMDCFVVGRCRPFSYPITIPVYEKFPDKFIDVLIHELIHNLFRQNFEETNKNFAYFNKKYNKETDLTRKHIPLQAIHTHIYLKFFGKNRLERDINNSPRIDYQRAWEIIQKQGYQNIISEFVKRVK